MKQALAVLCIAIAALTGSAVAQAPRVDYTLTPVLQNGELRAVAIELSFRGEADGETEINLPNEWGGQSELWRGIEGLTATNATIAETDSPARRVLRHRPNARVRVAYRVIQDWEGPPAAGGGNPYRPVVQPSYFHLIGETALIFPALPTETSARFRVRNMPRGWAFASDLEHAALTLESMHQSIMVGGADFRILREGQLRLAIRGDWSFSDASFLAQTAGILRGQREFWGDEESPFLVTMIQLHVPRQGMYSTGGTGLDDGFAFFATPNVDTRPITRTLAHEANHTWIPGQIGGTPEENEAAYYWLSEGFTDFYTPRQQVRSGLWTPADFATDFNDMLRAYARSPVRTAPNTRIAEDFWTNSDVQRLPYQRGQLLATLWDARLRAHGGNFDTIIRDMRRRAATNNDFSATELFPQAAEAAGLDLGDDLTTYVRDGAAIVLPEDIFAPCGRIITREAPVFERGWDADATLANNSIITGADPHSAAYAAGMRDGMAYVGRVAGEPGNADLEIAYVVRDGDTERTIRYMPRGQSTFTLQTFVLAEPLEGGALEQCRSILGGGT